MEIRKHKESLELSAQELEEIAGGIAEYQPETPSVDIPSSGLYNEVVKKVNDSLYGANGGGYTYYKKEEYQIQSPEPPNSAA